MMKTQIEQRSTTVPTATPAPADKSTIFGNMMANQHRLLSESQQAAWLLKVGQAFVDVLNPPANPPPAESSLQYDNPITYSSTLL